MKELVAFDLDGTLAESKQPLQEPMGEALANLLEVAHVAVISGGDWPQFLKMPNGTQAPIPQSFRTLARSFSHTPCLLFRHLIHPAADRLVLRPLK